MPIPRTSPTDPGPVGPPAWKLPSGQVVAFWEGPPPGAGPRAGREPEFERAERLMAFGISRISREVKSYAIARRCFHAATVLYAWSLGADRRLAFAWDRLGYAHHCMGDHEAAETFYLRSLEIQQRSGQPFTGWNECTFLNLAAIYKAAGRVALNESAMKHFRVHAPLPLPGAAARVRDRGHDVPPALVARSGDEY